MISKEEALRRLKATKLIKKERIEVLRKRMCEKYEANMGCTPQNILFLWLTHSRLKESIEEFFAMNQAAMLYICETGDGKQGMRSRLFTYWFKVYEYNSNYSFHTTSVKDEDGIANFAALIIRNDNPLIVEIVSEFLETAKALQQKP